MDFLKQLSNLIFGTRYHLKIDKYHNASKDKITLNYFQQAEKRSITASGEYWHD